jgi:hypothetical protein
MRLFHLLIGAVLAVALVAPPAAAQTSLTETTLAAAATAGQNFVVLTSATGVSAGTGIYVDREFMIVASNYVSGTRVPVIRGLGGLNSSHAASVPVWFGPAIAFGSSDRAGSCVATEQPYLPVINVSNGAMYHCSATVEKWVDLRDLVIVACRTLLAADAIDQSCFTADRPYLLYKITEIHTTAESAGTLTLIPKRQQGTEAAASGDTLVAAAIDMVGAGAVAQTLKTPALTATESLLILQTGDRIGLDFTDDVAGELAGVTVTLYLIPL